LTELFNYVNTHAGASKGKVKGRKKARKPQASTDSEHKTDFDETADAEEYVDFDKEAARLAAKLAAQEKKAERQKREAERKAKIEETRDNVAPGGTTFVHGEYDGWITGMFGESVCGIGRGNVVGLFEGFARDVKRRSEEMKKLKEGIQKSQQEPYAKI